MICICGTRLYNLLPTSTPHLQRPISRRMYTSSNQNSPSPLPLNLFPTPHPNPLIPPTPLLPRPVPEPGQRSAPMQDLERGLERVHRVTGTLDRGRGVADAAGGEDSVEGWGYGEAESCGERAKRSERGKARRGGRKRTSNQNTKKKSPSA